MASTLIAYSTNNNVLHYFNITNADGNEVAGNVAATFGGGASRRYTADIPAGLPAGMYSFSLHRADNDRLRYTGDYFWDGGDIVNTEEELLTAADIETAVGNQLGAGVVLTNTDKADLVQQFEAALLNDADGQALLGAISANVEAAFNDETDGSPTLAGIQGVVAAALAAYSTATSANVSGSEAAVIAALPDATAANQVAIQNALASQANAIATIAAAQGAGSAECEIDIVQAADSLTHFVKGTNTVLRQWNITYVENPADPSKPTVTFTQTT